MRPWWQHLHAAELGPAQENLMINANCSSLWYLQQKQRASIFHKLPGLLRVHIHRVWNARFRGSHSFCGSNSLFGSTFRDFGSS